MDRKPRLREIVNSVLLSFGTNYIIPKFLDNMCVSTVIFSHLKLHKNNTVVEAI